MERPTDQETTALEEMLCYTHRFPRERAYCAMQGCLGDTGVSWEAEEVERKRAQEPLLWLLRERTGIGEAR